MCMIVIQTKRKYGHEINDFFFAQIHENDQKIFPLQFNFSQANFFNQQKSALITETFFGITNTVKLGINNLIFITVCESLF